MSPFRDPEASLNWIRLQSEYFRHRKTLRLVRRLGEIAALYPLRLWTWAVEQSPDGSLRDIDAGELAVICGFSGEPSALWDAMLECGFIQTNEGQTVIRSWSEHQGKLIERAERNAVRMREARSSSAQTEIVPPEPTPAKSSDFDTLWSALIRRKIGKGAARKAFDKQRKAGKLPPIADLVAKLKAMQASHSWSKEGGRFQPHLATWLNREGWHDEPEATPPPVVSKFANPANVYASGTPETAAPVSIQARLQRLADAMPDVLPELARWQGAVMFLTGDSEQIESALAEIDARMMRELRDMANAETMADIDAKVRSAWNRVKDRVSGETDAHTFRQTMESTLLRDHYGAPVLTLFGRAAREDA